jgi:hypothetical protein
MLEGMSVAGPILKSEPLAIAPKFSGVSAEMI